MSTNTNIASTPNNQNVTIFGEEFENHGGFRILSMEKTMHSEDPVDDLGYYIDSCNRYLPEEQVLAGYAEEDDLFPLIEACFKLREKYGHGGWVGAALLDYLRGVKGVEDAEAIRDCMLQEAVAQFEPLATAFSHQRKIDYVQSLRVRIPMWEKMVQDDKDLLAQMEKELALAA